MMKCRFACLSTRNSILPPLISVTALATSIVTVPVLGFGMSPRGPRILPSRPTLPIRSGVATAASKSVYPPATFSTSSSPPTSSAPASRACSARSPVAKTRTRAVLPVPCGRFTVPRTIWSALRGSTPTRNATSIVASYVVVDVFFASRIASSGAYSRVRSICSAAARYALLRCVICSSPTGCSCGQWASAWPCHGPGPVGPERVGRAQSCTSVLNGDAHRASGASDDLHRGLDVVGVEGLMLGSVQVSDLVLSPTDQLATHHGGRARGPHRHRHRGRDEDRRWHRSLDGHHRSGLRFRTEHDRTVRDRPVRDRGRARRWPTDHNCNL